MTDDPHLEDMWSRSMAEPVTRGELVDITFAIHNALLAHSAFEASLFAGSPDQQAQLGSRAVSATGEILDALNRMIDQWGAR
ncbi:hypothetical protein [Sphingomonas hengshuiensis]|uniref:Uncharacterized protein n=1 Tax=Sphingomonas hengshuiensis TaxID=1609977 RepID=A0A7U4J9Y4_9SPHN|nr:hypothetical protein [Sphingomonas hengshuiensis]AJP72946.1 hypothetical protein TS85_15825 [Sphingomonas hengshuiensis]